jgi:hypothetical protein
MAPGIVIRHPDTKHTVLSKDFVAFGTVAHKGGIIRGLLIDKHGKIIPGTRLKVNGPLNWAIRFRQADGVHNGPYFLVVYRFLKPEAAFVHFKLKARRPFGPITSQFPTNSNKAVCIPSFVAYGDADNTVTSVTATCTEETSLYNCIKSQLEDAPSWAFQFSKVTTGTYDLVVADSGGPPPSDEVDGISADVCPTKGKGKKKRKMVKR